MNYREFAPAAPLNPYVDCYWVYDPVLSSQEDVRLQRCLPLGTIELIVQVNAVPCIIKTQEQVWQASPKIYVTGLYTDTAFWKAETTTFMFGIRMKPESLVELFGVPAIELLNSFVDAEAVLGKPAGQMCAEMTGIFDGNQLVNIAERFLMARLRNLRAGRNYVTEVCQLVRRSKGNLSIGDLSEKLYVSERKLQRSFKGHIGTSIKTYQRIIRFRNAYEYARTRDIDSLKWTDVSYESGYFDQAHFNKDFKEFTGEAPSFFASHTEHFFQTMEASTGHLADCLLY